MKVSAIIPAVNEVKSLLQTLEILIQEAAESLHEIRMVVCDRTTRECLSVIRRAKHTLSVPVVEIHQPRTGLGDALQAGMEGASGSHLLILFSDLESDPRQIGTLLDLSRSHPHAIVQASRWLPGASFHGYGVGKLVLNAVAQKALRILFRTRVTDFTFGYRLIPAQTAHALPSREIRHGYVLESLLDALQMGVTVVEIPAQWRKRSEAASMITWRTYLHYLPITFRVLLRSTPAPKTPSEPTMGEAGG